MNRRRTGANLAALCVGLFAAALLVLALEGVALLVLRTRGLPTAPFLYDSSARSGRLPSMQQTWGKQLSVSYLDPHLGFAHDPESHPLFSRGIPGFVHYPYKGTNARPLCIVTLGGSTTDPLTPLFLEDPRVDPEDPYCWPKALQQNLEMRGIPAEVYNGGVAGYTSSQELLKLLRDVLPLKPNVVLCLDGINEVDHGHSVRNHPMVHRYQRILFEEVLCQEKPAFLPNLLSLAATLREGSQRTVQGVSFGTPVKASPAQQWITNIRASEALSAQFGVHFLVFLQPVLGVGAYEMNEVERQWFSDRGSDYAESLRSFYSEAQSLSAELEYCVDLTDVFAGCQACYLDARHQNENGVEVLAGAIAKEIHEQGFLCPPS